MPMFFFAALFVASFLLTAFLAPKPKIENAKASALSDFQFPRAKEGDPVPRGYGTYKTAGPNAIYTGDFEAQPIKKRVKTGLFSHKKVITGYKYLIGLDLAVALGPCTIFRRMWLGNNEIWNGCLTDCNAATADINLPDLFGGNDQNGGIGGTVAFYPGNFDQAQDSYLVAQLGAAVPAYVGIAHVVFRKFYFGNSANIDPISFEVAHFSNSLGFRGTLENIMPNGLDANPVEVLYDLCINDWGNMAIDPALVDQAGWMAAALTVYGEGNGWSGEIANPQQGADVCKDILNQINATMYQDPSTGTIKLKLIRNDYDVATLPTFGPAEISLVRNFTKKLWEDTFNRVRIKYIDRDKNYAEDAVAIADDFANIRFQGRLRATDIGMPGIKTGALANVIAARQLSNMNVPLFQAEVLLNRTAQTLRPGDVFKWTCPEYNIVSAIVRIRKFGMGTREDGTITAFIVQDEFSSDAVVYGTPEIPIGTGTDYTPNDIAVSKIYELPYFLLNASGNDAITGYTRYGTFALKPGAGSIDYFFMIEGTTEDTEALSNAPYSDDAQLVATIGQYDNFDTGVIPSLDIQGLSSPSILTNSDEAGVRTGVNLFYLGAELMAYETFVDNGDGTYTLLTVHRAMIDTDYEGHLAGDTLFFFDGQEGFADDDTAIAPFNAYLLDRTIAGRSTKAGATIDALTPVGRVFLPAPPDYVTVDAARVSDTYALAGANVTVAWNERNRTDLALTLEADATEAPEAGTTYRVDLVQGGTVLSTASGIAATSYVLAMPGGASGGAQIQVWAEVGGDASFTAGVYPILIVGADTLTIDGVPVSVDSDTIEFS